VLGTCRTYRLYRNLKCLVLGTCRTYRLYQDSNTVQSIGTPNPPFQRHSPRVRLHFTTGHPSQTVLLPTFHSIHNTTNHAAPPHITPTIHRLVRSSSRTALVVSTLSISQSILQGWPQLACTSVLQGGHSLPVAVYCRVATACP